MPPHRRASSPLPCARARTVAVVIALACVARAAPVARAYSSRAGSCEHAAVSHGPEGPTAGAGAYALRLGAPGVNVPGATVAVELRGARAFKGFLIRPVRADTDEALGAWGAAMPTGATTHGECPMFATHTSWHQRGVTSTVMPWIVPTLAKGETVRFEVTVVESYSRWFSFETTFMSGASEGAGDASVMFDPERAPAVDGEARAPDGSRAETGRFGGGNGGGGLAPGSGGGKADAAAEETLSNARFVHGVLMGLAWLIVSPGASLLARYGRRFDQWWFKAHLNAQCAAVALTALSAYLIIHVRGWEKPWGPHGRYGMMVLVVGAIQIYGGFSRKSIPRPAFKIWHRVLGVGTGALAAYNCNIGANMLARMEGMDPSSVANGAPRIVKLLVLVILGTGVMLERQRRVAFGRLKSVKSMV